MSEEKKDVPERVDVYVPDIAEIYAANGRKTDDGPRVITGKETARQLVEKFSSIADYWGALPNQTQHDACHGVIHSVLATLDGASLDVPAFTLVPDVDASDRGWLEDQGLNYYDETSAIRGESLHDMYHAMKREMKK